MTEPSPDPAGRIAQLKKHLKMVIQAAYTGSAEHGSFFRHGGGEMNPNAFLVLDDLTAELTALQTERDALAAEARNFCDAREEECDRVRELETERARLQQATTELIEMTRLLAIQWRQALCGTNQQYNPVYGEFFRSEDERFARDVAAAIDAASKALPAPSPIPEATR